MCGAGRGQQGTMGCVQAHRTFIPEWKEQCSTAFVSRMVPCSQTAEEVQMFPQDFLTCMWCVHDIYVTCT